MNHWRRLRPLALWSVWLLVSNAWLSVAGPLPGQMSGNGLLPMQAVLLPLCLALTIGWGTALVRIVRAYASPLRRSHRIAVGAGAAIIALLLISWSNAGLHVYERQLFNYYVHSLLNQYTLNYWSSSWSLWIGLACASAALACLLPSARPAPGADQRVPL